MRVYHYLESKWALDDIRRGRLKISKIDDMNDPYELRSVFSDHAGSQKALSGTAYEILLRNGALCFSRRWDSILMWSHYGDRHKGICLGFDILNGVARPVTYIREPILTGNLAVEHLSEFAVEERKKIVDALLGKKYSGWKYEKEIRVYAQRKEVDKETGHYFVKFNERLRLKEVIAGARFPLSRAPIDEAIEPYSNIKVYKACASAGKFRITKERW